MFTHMVSVLHANKHLIKFLIDLDYSKLKGQVAQGTEWKIPLILLREQVDHELAHTKVSSVLLKADTGADVNLMNNVTFDSLFNRSVLQLTHQNGKLWKYGHQSAW